MKQYVHYKEIIDADVKIIHNEKLTRSCVFVYSVAISHMFNDKDNKNRAIDAFNIAEKLGGYEVANH